MPESVKQEILEEGARRAVHASYKNLRFGLLAAAVAMFALTIGNVVAWRYVIQDDRADCLDRAERVEANRRLWNGIFEVIEQRGAEVEGINALQAVVDRELPPLHCN